MELYKWLNVALNSLLLLSLVQRLTSCLGLTMERILFTESPSDRPSKSMNDSEHLQRQGKKSLTG